MVIMKGACPPVKYGKHAICQLEKYLECTDLNACFILPRTCIYFHNYVTCNYRNTERRICFVRKIKTPIQISSKYTAGRNIKTNFTTLTEEVFYYQYLSVSLTEEEQRKSNIIQLNMFVEILFDEIIDIFYDLFTYFEQSDNTKIKSHFHKLYYCINIHQL